MILGGKDKPPCSAPLSGPRPVLFLFVFVLFSCSLFVVCLFFVGHAFIMLVLFIPPSSLCLIQSFMGIAVTFNYHRLTGKWAC